MGPLCPTIENHLVSLWEIRGWLLTVLCSASADPCSKSRWKPRTPAPLWMRSDSWEETQRSVLSMTSIAWCPKVTIQIYGEETCGVSLKFGVGGCGSGATPSWALQLMTSLLKGRNNYVHLTGSLSGCPSAEKASEIDNVLKSLTLNIWNQARVAGCECETRIHFWVLSIFQGLALGLTLQFLLICLPFISAHP